MPANPREAMSPFRLLMTGQRMTDTIANGSQELHLPLFIRGG